MQAALSPENYFNGVFVTPPATLKQKLKQVKAFVFDWDGVFNNGHKNMDGHSSFSEADSMGINLMRFSYFLLNKKLPFTAIITGENNQLAFSFAQREHFDAVYFKVADKQKALLHLSEQHRLSPAEVSFVFDDVLDLSAAKLAGCRFMVNRPASPMLTEYAVNNRLVDYITQFEGHTHAVREVSEIVMALGNNYNLTVDNRVKFSEAYKDYLALRQAVNTVFYTDKQGKITSQQ
jgi:3-deoxy-D-manno-octulosonate 8-phosphate phosphatase (KDO 8-P phosphatase)